MCPFIRSLPSPTSLFLKFKNYTTPFVTAALPFKWMALFFPLIKSEWMNMPRGTLRDVHAVLTLHRSRGSRRNSARRAPSRGMKSGAGQRWSSVPGLRSLSGSPGARKEQPSLAGPSRSRAAPRCRRRRCPGRCLAGANASD